MDLEFFAFGDPCFAYWAHLEGFRLDRGHAMAASH